MTDTTNAPQVIGISETFFTAFSKLPGDIRKKVLEFLPRYRNAPTANGLNLEKLKVNNYWSARVNDNYRAIIYRPEDGKGSLLLWVAPHDDAYDWAKKHVCAVNSVTGSLQIYETIEVPPSVTPPAAKPVKLEKPAAPEPATDVPSEPLFARCSDEDLLRIGVPAALLQRIRAVMTPEELHGLEKNVPADAWESLVWLADGEPYETVLEAYGEAKPTDDWVTAIQSERSQRSFRVIEDDEDMQRIVNASLEQWRVFLHPKQKRIVNSKSLAPTLVRGAAGTGKTVVAMHRAAHLVREPWWDPQKKLLFTTFTTNLSVDISQQLKLLCSPDELKRIEVTNVHAWVAEFLRRHGVKLTVVFPGNPDYEDCWSRALIAKSETLRFSDGFIREEWLRVVLPNNLSSEMEYLRVPRKGRGVSVTRNERKALWAVFEEMRNELNKKRFMTAEDACWMALGLLEGEASLHPYGAVVVDETQDLGPEALKLLAKLAVQGKDADGKDTEPVIFLAGDGQQRIYARVASLSACGINVRGRRSQRLTLTYRTTEEIRRAADAVLAGESFNDMDEGKESLSGNCAFRHGKTPFVRVAATLEDEVDWISECIDGLLSEGLLASDICVVARTQKLLNAYKERLTGKKYRVSVIARNKADDATSGLKLATMHRVKGLEFKAVFIAGANEGVLPLKPRDASDDPAEVKLQALTERSLFYVAASRARDALFVSAHGEAGAFLKALMSTKDN